MRLKNALFYILTLVIAIGVTGWLIALKGGSHEIYDGSQTSGKFWSAFLHGLQSPLPLLLLQMITILVAGRITGFLFRKIGQPAVVGEMAAGILLGASFLGHYFPSVSSYLFKDSSLHVLNLLSQTGLILFMFIVGLELDFKQLRSKAGASVMISHASIVAPFTLGILAAYFTYDRYAPAHVGFVPYALFVGISMSITAFPVLARIIQERKLSGTSLGTIAISCAAADDVTAWCILAVVIAIVKAGTLTAAAYTILLSVIYVLLMFKIIRPSVKKIMTAERIGNKNTIAVCIIILITSAFLTDAIGIHALFGAFVAGVIMPDDIGFRERFIDKIESVALFLLLPLFFVSTGLKTQLWSLDSPDLWMLCGMFILVAIAGKLGASALAARFTGLSWSESLQLGVLMNTRGLTELVVLNIGYDHGVISSEIFTMLVIMAFATTLMTGPLLNLFTKRLPNR